MSTTVAVSVETTRPVSPAPLDEMVHSSLPGVKFLARRLASRLPAHVDVEDLIQAGVVGLLQSVERFDPSRGIKFQTYASRRVEGAMLDYLRSLDWRPRSVRRRNRELGEACAAAEQRLGESAGAEDLAREMDVSTLELHELIQDLFSSGNGMVSSFVEEGAEDASPNSLEELADPSDSPETVVEREQLRKATEDAVERLPHKERTVVSLYYYEQRTMKEIGEVLGVKQGRISQLHSQAIERLRNRIQPAPRKRPQPKWVTAPALREAAA